MLMNIDRSILGAFSSSHRRPGEYDLDTKRDKEEKGFGLSGYQPRRG